MEKLSLTGKSNHGEGVDDTMRGISALIVDGKEIYIDNGAMHAKSRVERGIQFAKTKEEVENPRLVWVIWLTLHRFAERGQGYYGFQPFALWIDSNTAKGYKSLAESVNRMDKAVKGQVDIMPFDGIPGTVKLLGEFLIAKRLDLWENAEESFRQNFPQSND